MTSEQYFGEWLKVIDKKELGLVLSKLNAEYRTKLICPAQCNVFKAFKLCSYNNLKAVFVGQDPFPQKDVATGILFGNREETSNKDLSPSLQIIKDSVANLDIPNNCAIFDPSLENWAEQGILMLNSALTVEMNKIGSHVMLWRPFISNLLKRLSANKKDIIYVLFGKQAQTFKPYINKHSNTILEEQHPAYYAKTGIKMSSNVFMQVSEFTKEKYGVPITWYKE